MADSRQPEELPGAPSPHHPLVAAALALHGITPAEILAHPSWIEGQAVSYSESSGTLPRVTCRSTHTTVYWSGIIEDSVVLFLYEDMTDPAPTYWIHHLEFRNWLPPETIISALPGQPLDAVVKLPGGSDLIIHDAVEMARGLVLTLRHEGSK